jgi:hypothetical protein
LEKGTPMRKNFAAAALWGALIVSLAGCADTDPGIGATSFANGHYGFTPWMLLTAAVPPYNTLAFGTCEEEFGMPDYRRANCELYYRLRGTTAPWQQRQAAAQQATYAAGELRCGRTLGGVSECEPVGAVRKPPSLALPNNLGAD